MDKLFDFKYENKIVENKIKNIKLLEDIFKSIDNNYKKKFTFIAVDLNISGIKLSMFFNISENNLLYIDSFFLDCTYPIINKLNWQNYNHNNLTTLEELTINDFKICYKLVLTNFTTNPTSLIRGNIIENNNDIIQKIKVQTDGYYINNNDINFQILLWEFLLKNYENVGIENLRSNKFRLVNFESDNFYKNLLESNSIYLKYMIKKHALFCDQCDQNIHNFSSNIKIKNHWDYMGILHLCDKCFKDKKISEENRTTYLKKKILLQGKKILFKKELNNIKNLNYENKKITDVEFFKKMVKGLINDINKNNKNKICGICYDFYLDKKLGVSSCGHCFHFECVKNLKKCPICRNENPKFKELFL